jgi:hypothetical protein
MRPSRRLLALLTALTSFVTLLAAAAALGESLGETGPANTDTVLLATGIFVGVFGFAVDFGLGSAYRLEPGRIDTELEPLP